MNTGFQNCLILCAAMALTAFSFATTATAETCMQALDPTAVDMRMELNKHLIVPEYLSAAGVSPSQAIEVLNDSIAAIEDHWGAIQSANQALASAKEEFLAVERLIQRGQATDDDLAAYSALQTQVETAQTAHGNLHAVVDQEMLSSLPNEQHQQFIALRGNRMTGLPLRYQILDLAENTAIALRNALAALHTHDEEDNPPSAHAIQLVNQYDGMYLVNLVTARTDASLSAITQHYEAALGSGN